MSNQTDDYQIKVLRDFNTAAKLILLAEDTKENKIIELDALLKEISNQYGYFNYLFKAYHTIKTQINE